MTGRAVPGNGQSGWYLLARVFSSILYPLVSFLVLVRWYMFFSFRIVGGFLMHFLVVGW